MSECMYLKHLSNPIVKADKRCEEYCYIYASICNCSSKDKCEKSSDKGMVTPECWDVGHELKLFVWEDFNYDKDEVFDHGLAFAIAGNAEEAKKLIVKQGHHGSWVLWGDVSISGIRKCGYSIGGHD